MVIATALFVLALSDTGSVRIATTVTDSAGRPVHGLTAKDFAVTEDGVARTIEAVEARSPEPRRIAILLDEFHVDPADTLRVREALTAFVDRTLRDGDLALVLKPLDPLSSIRLTGDRESLRRAIASFEGRKGNYEPRNPLEAETLGSAPALVEMGRAQVVLSALRAMTAQLGGHAGRSAILLVTEGFVPPRRRAATSRGLPDSGMVQRFANRYDVPIYAFDPRQTVPGDDARSGTISRLVNETGGAVWRGADLTSNLTRAAGELDSGYTIVFTSAHGDDGRYHPVQVTVTRAALDARSRAGYISPPSEETRRAMRELRETPRVPARMLKRSPLVQVWSGVTRLDNGQANIAVTWQPGTGPAGRGRSPAARVELRATTPDGRVLYEGTLAPVVSGESSDGERAEFSAPAGRVQLDMTVLGIGGQRLDVDARDLEVQLPRGSAPLLLPPVLIPTQSAREFREVAERRDAAPAPDREFRRTERLIIRAPAYGASGPLPVTGRLLNRIGQTVMSLSAMPAGGDGVTQFDLPLAPLAPGDYFLQLSVQGPAGEISQRLPIKITG